MDDRCSDVAELKDRWRRRLVLTPEWLRVAAVLSQTQSLTGHVDPVAREWASAVVSYVAGSSGGKAAIRAMVALDKVRWLSPRRHGVGGFDALGPPRHTRLSDLD